MRILFCGDLVGRAGRNAAIEMLPRLRRELSLDFVVVNGENAAGGFGITEQICNQLYAAGVDVITTGNHVWDQKETLSFIPRHSRLLRPENFPAGTPGEGHGVFEAPGAGFPSSHVAVALCTVYFSFRYLRPIRYWRVWMVSRSATGTRCM